jgi:hypothetical protein
LVVNFNWLAKNLISYNDQISKVDENRRILSTGADENKIVKFGYVPLKNCNLYILLLSHLRMEFTWVNDM